MSTEGVVDPFQVLEYVTLERLDSPGKFMYTAWTIILKTKERVTLVKSEASPFCLLMMVGKIILSPRQGFGFHFSSFLT